MSADQTLTKDDHAHPRGSGAGARIEAEGIWKRYGEVAACRDVNLTIEASEFVTLLGPSGSGKTTLLNIIAGFTKPTEGSLKVDGHDLTRTPSHKRDIGMVFQQYALFPHMTVAENVMFPLKQRKMPAAEAKQKVQLALQTVHLGDLGHRRPGQLSGGQQQRVALARAIVYGPRVLLMDEPLGALDKKLREWLQLEIKRVHREVGSTFVFVTHNQEEALVLSDRIAVFNNGGIEQVGTADELYERPRTLFVARFLGDSTTLRGTASARSDGGTDLDVGGSVVRAAGRLDSAAGAVVVRPERMRILDSGEVPAGMNAIKAKVVEAVYLGSARVLQLQRRDGTELTVREPAGSWSNAERGQTVLAGWRIEDGVLLADDPEAEKVYT